jgi:hypothetical protein
MPPPLCNPSRRPCGLLPPRDESSSKACARPSEQAAPGSTSEPAGIFALGACRSPAPPTSFGEFRRPVADAANAMRGTTPAWSRCAREAWPGDVSTGRRRLLGSMLDGSPVWWANNGGSAEQSPSPDADAARSADTDRCGCGGEIGVDWNWTVATVVAVVGARLIGDVAPVLKSQLRTPTSPSLKW